MILWPVGIYGASVLLVVALIMGVSYVLGQRHRERATGDPYESGILVTGSARVRLPVKFYLVALFFVVFDLESVFIFSWAVAARDLGWVGYVEILAFIGSLLSALAYLWRIGALDWGTLKQKSRPFPTKGEPVL
jgi:NADH-quinone oxidoreductase subunit A